MINYIKWDIANEVALGGIGIMHESQLPPHEDGFEWREIVGDIADTTLELINGEIVETKRQLPIEVALSLAKQSRWETVKTQRDKALKMAITSYGAFDSDDTSLMNIKNEVDRLNALVDDGVTTTWRMADNQDVVFSKADFALALMAVIDWRSNIYARSWTIEASINACQTVEAVDALTWSWAD